MKGDVTVPFIRLKVPRPRISRENFHNAECPFAKTVTRSDADFVNGRSSQSELAWKSYARCLSDGERQVQSRLVGWCLHRPRFPG